MLTSVSRLSMWPVTAALAVAHAGDARAVTRPGFDARDVESMQQNAPAALAQVLEAEADVAAGRLSHADELLGQSEAAAPLSALASRRHCQVLTAMGRRDEAIAACKRAISASGSDLDMRALAHAYMTGPIDPTPQELNEALMMTERMEKRRGNEMWGHAARCDIARRVDDLSMWSECMQELREFSIDHQETRLAEKALSSGLRWQRTIPWIGLLSACLGTVVAKLRVRWVRRIRHTGVAAVGLASILMLASRGANADGAPGSSDASVAVAVAASAPPEEPGASSKWKVDDEHPELHIPSDAEKNANPLQFGYLLMDLSGRAEKAYKAADWPNAIKYFRALAVAVPDASLAFGKLCEMYEKTGQLENAELGCRTAISKSGVTLGDYARFASILLAKPAKLTPETIRELDDLVDHLRKQGVERRVPDEIACELGARLGDADRLRECVPGLVAVAPSDPRTITFRWSLAMAEGNYSEARTLVEKARVAKVGPDGIRRMEIAISEVQPLWRRLLADFRVIAGIALIAMGIVYFMRDRRARLPGATPAS